MTFRRPLILLLLGLLLATVARGESFRVLHRIHFYDVGIGGDGLRGPSEGFDNPYRQFLAHDDVPEVWNGKQLVSGGKHYGHLEVNVAQNAIGQWLAELTPVQVFPLLDSEGKVTGWERRTYDDVVTITAPAEK